jgi:hypothetical protein
VECGGISDQFFHVVRADRRLGGGFRDTSVRTDRSSRVIRGDGALNLFGEGSVHIEGRSYAFDNGAGTVATPYAEVVCSDGPTSITSTYRNWVTDGSCTGESRSRESHTQVYVRGAVRTIPSLAHCPSQCKRL